MKFTCKTTELLQALNVVGRAISGQQALPILSNILIEAEGKRCTVSATDLELSIITSFEADIENEGSITIPAKAFLNFAQYSSDDEVLLETSEGTQLLCTGKNGKTVIAGEPAGEYPTIAPIEKETSFTLEAAPLLTALDLVTFASARTTLRPVLSGVYVRTEKDALVLVATDSYRLSEVKVKTDIGSADVSCIIPTKVLDELKGMLGGGKKSKEDSDKEDSDKEDAKTIDVSLSAQQIEIRVGPTTILSRLIDGKFPDYQQIIPSDSKSDIDIPTKELLTTVKRMHYFAKEINNNLTLSLDKKGLTIVTPPTQAGRDEAHLEVGYDGGENKIALSSAYLLDFLGHMGDENVHMKIVDSMHPAVFTTASHEHFLHLIMPLRIQEES